MKIVRRGLREGVALTVGAGVVIAVAPLATAHPGGRQHAGRAAVIVTWNRAMIDALGQAKTPAPAAPRITAIVASSVYDAVNGITRIYTPYHVAASAPAGASAAAAAIGAAHESLSMLFPDQGATFDALEAQTLAAAHGSVHAVQQGLAWGVSVADQILAWRATDGSGATPPPYVASSDPGRWQPTAPLFGPPLFRQYSTTTPWAMTSPDQFRPPAPPALTSARYTKDYAEVKSIGSLTSTTRSSFDTQTAQMWQSDVGTAIWDRIADSLLETRAGRRLSLTASARLLARTNIAMADAVISIWDSKNFYDRWRPVTAIHAADTDGNPATVADPTWAPLLVTPPFQEYPAAHPGISQAAASVLAAQFGDNTSFTATSAQLPGVTRDEPSFSAAVAQVVDARVLGGIHFRFSGNAARMVGAQIARLVLHTQLLRRPCEGRRG